MPAFQVVKDEGLELGSFTALAGCGIVHAVTTRRTMDVHRVRAEPGAAAVELAATMELPAAAWAEQIHSDIVLTVPAGAGGRMGKADGLVTAAGGIALVARSADCPLILIADAEAGVVGVAHASWRGTVQQIARRLVEAAVRLGAEPRRMTAAICPSAGPCCYEVGRDVLDAAVAGIGSAAEAFFKPHGEKWKLDLWSANRSQLESAGLPAAGIHVAEVCTICRNDLFPSHRREGEAAGRFMAAIGLFENQVPAARVTPER